jgi:hypothetical protein
MGCSTSKDATDTLLKTPDTEPVKVGSHLTKADDITGLPVFPEGTKSLLSKYITPQVWKQLKDKKDKAGFSFKEAIFSGCKNTDSGIGVYAGSHDSYTTFAPLFDKIIEDYHQHKKNDKHVSDMDASKLNAPPFSEEDGKMIVSTRIRVGRNLEGFPLGPAITNEQRNEIMAKVVAACNTFEGDLKGTFYALDSMD